MVCSDFSVTSSIVASILMYALKTFCVVCYIARSEMAWSLGGYIFNPAFIRVTVLVYISICNNLIFLNFVS